MENLKNVTAVALCALAVGCAPAGRNITGPSENETNKIQDQITRSIDAAKANVLIASRAGRRRTLGRKACLFVPGGVVATTGYKTCDAMAFSYIDDNGIDNPVLYNVTDDGKRVRKTPKEGAFFRATVLVGAAIRPAEELVEPEQQGEMEKYYLDIKQRQRWIEFSKVDTATRVASARVDLAITNADRKQEVGRVACLLPSGRGIIRLKENEVCQNALLRYELAQGFDVEGITYVRETTEKGNVRRKTTPTEAAFGIVKHYVGTATAEAQKVVAP